MNDDLRKRIEELQERKAEITSIERKREETRVDFRKKIFNERMAFEKRMSVEKDNYERSLVILDADRTKLFNEVRSLGKDLVSIKMGDLIEELAFLKDIDVSNISVVIDPIISFSGNYSMKQVSELINTIYYDYIINLVVELTGNCETNSSMMTLFTYLIRLNAKFTDVQSDGRTLLEHCTAKVIYDARAREYRTDLYIDRNINDLILNIPLSYLVRESESNWYPADLMRQAVINCVERNNKEEVSKDISKKRVRTLSEEINK